MVTKALRANPEHFDIRMLLAKDPSSSRSQMSTANRGAYEIRRRDLEHAQLELTQDYWDERTLYLVSARSACREFPQLTLKKENIPPPSRSLPALEHFILAQVQPPERIEALYFPSHHQDRANRADLRKCKGFAFVVFSSASAVARLHHLWPWDNNPSKEPKSERGEQDVEAHRFGFRTLPQPAYHQLQQEYLAHRQTLVEEMALDEDEEVVMNVPPKRAYPIKRVPDHYPPPFLPSTDTQHNATPQKYPPNVLLFIRNIHPDTNKTSLRKLLSSSEDAIDYVDYTKGMDSVRTLSLSLSVCPYGLLTHSSVISVCLPQPTPPRSSNSSPHHQDSKCLVWTTPLQLSRLGQRFRLNSFKERRRTFTGKESQRRSRWVLWRGWLLWVV